MKVTVCYCCADGCPLPATVMIWDGPGPEDGTHSCPRHVRGLTSAMTPTRLFLIETDGTEGPEILLKEPT